MAIVKVNQKASGKVKNIIGIIEFFVSLFFGMLIMPQIPFLANLIPNSSSIVARLITAFVVLILLDILNDIPIIGTILHAVIGIIFGLAIGILIVNVVNLILQNLGKELLSMDSLQSVIIIIVCAIAGAYSTIKFSILYHKELKQQKELEKQYIQ